MFAFKPLQRVVVLFLCLVAFDTGLCVWASSNSFGVANENGPLENTQILILCACFLTYAYLVAKQEDAARSLAAVFCFLCVFLILKELDFKQLKLIAPDVGYWVENTTPERTIKLLQWFNALFLIVFLISRRRDISVLVRAMVARSAWPFYLCFALLLLSQAVEPDGFPNPETLAGAELYKALTYFAHMRSIGQFWEELIELNAYFVLLYAALTAAVVSSLVYVGDRRRPAMSLRRQE